jgi:hypothetical protein
MYEVRCPQCGCLLLLAPATGPARHRSAATAECPQCHARNTVDARARLAARLSAANAGGLAETFGRGQSIRRHQPPAGWGDDPQPTAPEVSNRDAAPIRDPGPFDWLEGATGVCVHLVVADGLLRLTVEGDLDRASLGVVESALLEALDRSPARVELVLGAASSFTDEAIGLVTRARRRAQARRVPFLLRRLGDRDG